MSRRTHLPGLFLASIALVGAVAACSGGSDSATSPPGSSSGPTSAPTSGVRTGRPTHPTGTPSSSEFTQGPTQNPNGSPASRAKAAQIPAGELPGLNDSWTWRIQSEGPGSGDAPASLCELSSLEAIGATSEYRTEYDSRLSRSAHATVITAVFPDQQTAVLAKTVLRSWHALCAHRLKARLGYQNVTVSPIGKVDTDVGAGEQWLSSYGPVQGRHPNVAWFQAEGFISDGDTLTYVVILSAGQDYNYEAGQQPVELALQVAAAKLEQTR